MFKVFTLRIVSLMIMLLVATGTALASNLDQSRTPTEFYALSGFPTPPAMTDAELAKVQGQNVDVEGSQGVYSTGGGNGTGAFFFQFCSETCIYNKRYQSDRGNEVPAKAGPPPNAAH